MGPQMKQSILSCSGASQNHSIQMKRILLALTFVGTLAGCLAGFAQTSSPAADATAASVTPAKDAAPPAAAAEAAPAAQAPAPAAAGSTPPTPAGQFSNRSNGGESQSRSREAAGSRRIHTAPHQRGAVSPSPQVRSAMPARTSANQPPAPGLGE